MKRILNIATIMLVVITAVDAYMYYSNNYRKPWFILSALLAAGTGTARMVKKDG